MEHPATLTRFKLPRRPLHRYRMRNDPCHVETKILPSPILPVCAVRIMVSTCGIDNVVRYDNLNFHFRQKIHHILRTAVQLGMAFLAAKTFHLSDRHAGNTDFSQCSRTSSSLKGLIIASIFSCYSLKGRLSFDLLNVTHNANSFLEIVCIQFVSGKQFIKFCPVAPRHSRRVVTLPLVILQQHANS